MFGKMNHFNKKYKFYKSLSDEAYYPWESPKKIRLKSGNPTIATEQKKVLILR